MSTAFLLERVNTQQFLDYLKSEASSEDVKARLVAVLERKLGHGDVPLTEGTSKEDRMERFFDTVLEVAPLPPVPYSPQELIHYSQFAANLLREESVRCLALDDEDDKEAGRSYAEDAATYEKMADLFAKGDDDAARKIHREMDTYTREWFFTLDGADASRYFAKGADQ
jgi:hypothetical protein